MKANELMVGDFVMMGKKIYRCANICGHTNDVLLDNGVITNVGNLSPIPLTPEILEKNGFVYNDENEKYYPNCWENNGILLHKRTLNGFFYMVPSDYDDQDTNCTSIIITYVHELQHLLKLCRIEKQIEL